MAWYARFSRVLISTAAGAFLFACAAPTASEASSNTSFSANAHRAALLEMLDSHTRLRINQLSFAASPTYPTWVYYRIGTRNSGGEDIGEGFAHWVNGRWIDLYGPWSVECGPLRTMVKIPRIVRNYFAVQSYCKGSNGTLG
jgi:hypothetical protein